MIKYAGVDKDNNLVVYVWDTVNNPDMTPAPEDAPIMDIDITNHPQRDGIAEAMYLHSDGTFSLYPEGYVEPVYQPSNQEIFQAISLLNQAEIITNQRKQDPMAIQLFALEDTESFANYIKRFYDIGLYNQVSLQFFVFAGKITREDYKTITGEDYPE